MCLGIKQERGYEKGLVMKNKIILISVILLNSTILMSANNELTEGKKTQPGLFFRVTTYTGNASLGVLAGVGAFTLWNIVINNGNFLMPWERWVKYGGAAWVGALLSLVGARRAVSRESRICNLKSKVKELDFEIKNLLEKLSLSEERFLTLEKDFNDYDVLSDQLQKQVDCLKLEKARLEGLLEGKDQALRANQELLRDAVTSRQTSNFGFFRQLPFNRFQQQAQLPLVGADILQLQNGGNPSSNGDDQVD